MTELDLYKFITKNGIEWHPCYSDDIVMFVNYYDVDEFGKLLEDSSIFDDEGIECSMKDGYFAYKMRDICEHFGIELKNVFLKEEEQ